METTTEKNEQLKTFLNEAVDLLDDIKDKLGMFQAQRYYRLKRDLERMEREHSLPMPAASRAK